jgi:membrane protein DedA with SNARE-associated domain
VTVPAEALMGLFVAYGYWIVFTAILLDNAGLPIPGELLLVAFGIAARSGHLDLAIGLAVAAAAALAGDSVGYWIGRLGRARLGRAPRFRPGLASVVFGRFVIGARVLLAPLAGASRMPFARFLVVDAAGCLVWSSAFIVIGYASGVSLEAMEQGLRVMGVAVQSVLLAVLATWAIVRLVLRRRRLEA